MRSALAGQHRVADTEVAQSVFESLFAVAAVGGDGAWCLAGAVLDPFECRLQLFGVGRVAGFDVVVDDDAVFVVDDLGLVAELDGAAESSLDDRPGVAVV